MFPGTVVPAALGLFWVPTPLGVIILGKAWSSFGGSSESIPNIWKN